MTTTKEKGKHDKKKKEIWVASRVNKGVGKLDPS
jgi:hypothetical protein